MHTCTRRRGASFYLGLFEMYVVDSSNVLKQFCINQDKILFLIHYIVPAELLTFLLEFKLLEWAPETLCMTIGEGTVQPLIIYLRYLHVMIR